MDRLEVLGTAGTSSRNARGTTGEHANALRRILLATIWLAGILAGILACVLVLGLAVLRISLAVATLSVAVAVALSVASLAVAVAVSGIAQLAHGSVLILRISTIGAILTIG